MRSFITGLVLVIATSPVLTFTSCRTWSAPPASIIYNTRGYSASRAEAIYVAVGNAVQPYRIERDGTLTPLRAVAVPSITGYWLGAPARVEGLEYCPINHCLYAYWTMPHRWKGQAAAKIYVFHVAPDGSLLAQPDQTVMVNQNVGSVTIDPKGRFLFAFCSNGIVTSYRLNGRGLAGTSVQSHVQLTFAETGDDGPVGGISDHGYLITDPTGRHAFIHNEDDMLDFGDVTTVAYKVLNNGLLKEDKIIELIHFSDGGRSNKSISHASALWRTWERSECATWSFGPNIRVSPPYENISAIDGHRQLVYSTREYQDFTISAVDKSGGLSMLSRIPIPVPLVNKVFIAAQGRYVYISGFEQVSQTVLGFNQSLIGYRVDAKGHPTKLFSITVATKQAGGSALASTCQ